MSEILCARATVTAVHQPSASFRRLVLAGPDLLAASGDLLGEAGATPAPRRDAYVKLLIPPPGREPVVLDPAQGMRGFFARPEAERGWMRTYTVRAAGWSELDGEPVPALTIDVALHGGDTQQGPGLRWAREAGVGDTVNVLVPGTGAALWSGWRHCGAAQVLAVGDETAAPAMVSILEELRDPSSGFRGTADVVIELSDGGALADLAAGATALEADWPPPAGGVLGAPHVGGEVRLHVGNRAPGAAAGTWAASRLAQLLGVGGDADALFAPPPPADPASREWELAEAVTDGLPYVFLAGESAMVRGLRQLCVRERGIPKSRVSFMGYWRCGQAES